MLEIEALIYSSHVLNEIKCEENQLNISLL
jgi:hypothetical protein